jgi:hypothetical protein
MPDLLEAESLKSAKLAIKKHGTEVPCFSILTAAKSRPQVGILTVPG